MHLQACFKSAGHVAGDFPWAEAAANEALAIPIYPELTREQGEFVADSILAFPGA
jgi:dTDP-4-amino-4,6-dideoxygalactose transaminase